MIEIASFEKLAALSTLYKSDDIYWHKNVRPKKTGLLITFEWDDENVVFSPWVTMKTSFSKEDLDSLGLELRNMITGMPMDQNTDHQIEAFLHHRLPASLSYKVKKNNDTRNYDIEVSTPFEKISL